MDPVRRTAQELWILKCQQEEENKREQNRQDTIENALAEILGDLPEKDDQKQAVNDCCQHNKQERGQTRHRSRS